MNPARRTRVVARISRVLLWLAFTALAATHALANPANQSAPWRINGNGFPGDVSVQQAADGTLSGTIYGEPLTGYYAAGERIGVWLRGAPTQPMQAFVGTASPDGQSFTGRFYGLNTSTSGASPQRNVFAFSALRAAPSHPGHPGVPASAAGPASVTGTLPLVANGHAGLLVLNQTPDGSLSGTIYGDRLSGHYAQGTGTIAFLRFTAAQPVQLYIGSVTAQGIGGEFYALTVPAGGSAQRMRYGWSAQPPQPVQGRAAPVAQLPFAANSGIAGGAILASINEPSAAQCLARCQAMAGCTGFQFAGGAFGGPGQPNLPGASCTLFSGATSLRPQNGLTACLMPCDASLSAPWRLNGNGYPGEVMLQQAADGTLSGTIYGNPLTGFHSAGDRSVVWLRGAPTQPDQAFVGSVSADGNSISGRMYGLTISGGGVGPARNVFAFSALRAAPNLPGHPGLPPAAAGPASVAGTLALNANNHPGQLALTQAPDGMLSGSIYGDRLSGHYAPGSGSIALLRFTGTQPTQLYVGTVSAQGISGEFYALTVPAGGSAQRMRYGWSAQMPQVALAAQAPAVQGAYVGPIGKPPLRSGVAVLPAAATTQAPASAPPANPAAGRLSGFEVVAGPTTTIAPLSVAQAVAQCPNRKVALSVGYRIVPPSPDAQYGIEVKAAMPRGSEGRVTIRNANAFVPVQAQANIVCVDAHPALREVRTYYFVEHHENVARGEAGCEQDRIVGGGFDGPVHAHPATNAPRDASQPSPGGFSSSAIKTSPLALRATVSVTALCLPAAAVPDWEVVASAPQELGPRSSTNMTLACPGGKRMLARGFSMIERARISKPVALVTSSLVPTEARAPSGAQVPGGSAAAVASNRAVVAAEVRIWLAGVCATVP